VEGGKRGEVGRCNRLSIIFIEGKRGGCLWREGDFGILRAEVTKPKTVVGRKRVAGEFQFAGACLGGGGWGLRGGSRWGAALNCGAREGLCGF